MSIEDPDLDWPTAVPEMKSAEIPVLVLARKYFRKIKRGNLRALSSHGRFTDVQCSHLIARSPCDFCPKRRSINTSPAATPEMILGDFIALAAVCQSCNSW